MLEKKSVKDIEVGSKRVLVRCDFNVPLDRETITNITKTFYDNWNNEAYKKYMEKFKIDENKNPIIIDDTIFNAKYLSDITFSSHDYILNTLLTLLPQKIFIHLIDPTLDEFINTLQLVFEGRIEFCTECPICKLYNINKYMK